MPNPDDPPGITPPEPLPIPVVATVGPRLDEVILLLREYLHLTGAARAIAVVDRDLGEAPALVDCPRLAPIEVTADERTVALPHAIPLDGKPPALPMDLRQLPNVGVAFDANGEVRLTGTIGGLEHMAHGVIALAQALGGRNVAMALFDTDLPDVALSISARRGEPVVVSVGDEELEMPDDWPPPRSGA